MIDYHQKAISIKSQITENQEILRKESEKYNSNITKLKSLNQKFISLYNNLISEIETIPQTKLESKLQTDNNIESDISPASIISHITWEWLYNELSTKQFTFNSSDDSYSTGQNTTSGYINAYSSHSTDTNFIWKINFINTQSFGCGGFGIISKNDPKFNNDNYTNFGGHPLMCLCCNGSWSGSYMTILGTRALQYILKEDNNSKCLTFEVNMDENLFKIYDPNDNLHATYDLKNMSYNDDLVLIYSSGSSTNHSHQIVYDC